MKSLIFLGGASGTGKTTAALSLVDRLEGSVMLDGDWTAWQGVNWDSCQENIEMQMQNICFMLNNFLRMIILKI